ncbi:hypothetical protein A3C19_03045 [Candidatus Kaiserbacteria bacterium RIFCSPHIGHO2_02_FULL_54_22]|uniref:Uncharacterized protein n=1 Tax=Candidatus Kaiserbacteria bacterium RIFCSPHIGHO2_02_FULL_54_22 TaxID=1798495 RepID=A0A1F6DLQ2_9BACT|nr:MAG: hypothetical protein A3C19_03045 [Candidatus Kaiserbacteria bacterium RIFCSPHIGHO2_02_FULL_54_22]OGG68262.1 MAG: hypothetical protein A3E99_00860 [Candidatus Kaiserbacteria bacterium RIFCSPHIGHO2_12_FULL_54_16]OGG90231.1 MAG: hypothetical protein A3G12_02485 [Candidatus Kaiserbacteria bacterium RIFCSPLOWO2_12_FULL_54_10]
MENPAFLKKFPNLSNALEVIKAKERTEIRTGKKTKGDFESLIQNYLNRFTEFKNHIKEAKDGRSKDKAIGKFKSILMDRFITKYENIPENYWREKDEEGTMGPFFREINDHGLSGDWGKMNDEEKEKYKREHAETLIENQQGSLEEWLDYFLDDDLSGDIPDYLKYWIFRSVTNLQEYEKPKNWDNKNLERETTAKEGSGEKKKENEGQFPRRSKNSLKNYPDLHPEALRYVADAVVNKYKGQDNEFGYDIQPDEQEKFKQYLEQENFAKLYAWAMESFNPIPEELLPITDGEWVLYPKGSNVDEVVKKLKGKGTGLCIAGKGAAHRYLNSGDLHIFFSNDEEGNPSFPRVAIHVEDGQITEMRGIAYKQNIDPYITDVVSAKLPQFQNGSEYEKKSEDMKKLTEIENKVKERTPLSKDELIFLYEIEAPIRYFGMRRDPRIAELRDARDTEADMTVLFECAPEDIAHSVSEMRDTTKAYVGELESGIFDALPKTVEHIYTKFPEEWIKLRSIELGTGIKNGQAFQRAIKAQGMKVYISAKNLLESPDFKVVGEREHAELVEVSVRSFGFKKMTRYDKICERAKELGFELCPAEVGPQLRLQYTDQSLEEYLIVAMNAVNDSDGDPNVFHVTRDYDGLWLNAYNGRPDYEWSPEDRFIFLRPRK